MAGKGPQSAYASPHQLVLGYAYLGDNDRALSFLEKSASAKEGQILYIKSTQSSIKSTPTPASKALEKRSA